MDAFEKLDIWKRSSRLCVELYKALVHCRDRGFRDQITRSALSVPSNIAEGYERDSRQEFIRYLRIAKGSSGELRTQIYIGLETGLIPKGRAMHFVCEAKELSKMISSLINRLEKSGAC